jgi:glycosyltransferase involved in cell wall biosynthesis
MECTIGGTRRHLVDVVLGQKALGLDVFVTASTLRQPDFEADLVLLEKHGVVVTRLPMLRAIRPTVDAGHFAFLRRQLERVRPDIVHTHASKAGVLGRLASIQTDIGKRVHTPHTFSFLFEAEFPRPIRALFRGIERALSGHTHAVVAVSPGEARTFSASGVVEPERVHVVQNGIDARPWIEASAVARSEIGVSAEDPFVLVVGLLNIAKGQDLALQALARPGLDDVQCVIVGHGAMEAELRALAARLRLDSRVHFLGYRTDVPRLVAACDFVLLPSRWEGMPYVVLEAMAGGKAVVTTPVDGAIDLVDEGRTGFVARAIDPDAIAEALRAMTALTARERARMGEIGRVRLLEHHSAQSMVAGLVDVYEAVR